MGWMDGLVCFPHIQNIIFLSYCLSSCQSCLAGQITRKWQTKELSLIVTQWLSKPEITATQKKLLKNHHQKNCRNHFTSDHQIMNWIIRRWSQRVVRGMWNIWDLPRTYRVMFLAGGIFILTNSSLVGLPAHGPLPVELSNQFMRELVGYRSQIRVCSWLLSVPLQEECMHRSQGMKDLQVFLNRS